MLILVYANTRWSSVQSIDRTTWKVMIHLWQCERRQQVYEYKQADKFRDSLVVRIYSDSGDKTSGITFRCTLGTAESIVMGCSAIADVLRGHSPKKSKSRPSSSATDGNMAHSSSQQYVANQAFGTVQLPASIPVGVPSGGMSSGQQYSLSSQSGRMPNNQGIVFPPQQQVFAKSYAESGAPHLWEA